MFFIHFKENCLSYKLLIFSLLCNVTNLRFGGKKLLYGFLVCLMTSYFYRAESEELWGMEGGLGSLCQSADLLVRRKVLRFKQKPLISLPQQKNAHCQSENLKGSIKSFRIETI